MKSRVLISLLLALVMLFTLAVPVLADREKGTLQLWPMSTEPGTGKWVMQTTHDNYLKVVVSLRGATPLAEYRIIVHSASPTLWSQLYPLPLETDSRGNGRLRLVTSQSFASGDRLFDIRIARGPEFRFRSGNYWVTFK